MKDRFFSLLAVSVCLGLSLFAGNVHAQQWGDPIQVVTPIEYDSPIKALLDSLTAVLERNPDLQVRRAPNDEPTSVEEIETALLDDGLTLGSASHVFLSYRFALVGGRVAETLDEMQFVYNESDAQQIHTLLHVSTAESAVSKVLTEHGFARGSNLNATTSFRKLTSFPVLGEHKQTFLVELDRGPSFYNFERRRVDELTQYLKTFVYTNADPSYVLTTGYERAQQDSPLRLFTIKPPAEASAFDGSSPN